MAADERVRVVASNLRVDAAGAEVIAALADSRVPAIVLKGASLARWLYTTEEPRGYSDVDLLVDPDQLDAVATTLVRIGFRRRYDPSGLPDWWLEHGSEWWRDQDGVWVDVHRTIPGVGVEPRRVWQTLSTSTEPMQLAGKTVSCLSAPARACHVVLHAAHHGEAWGKALRDLERAMDIVDDATWRAAARVAEDLAATDAFGIGLRLHPRGIPLADRLGIPPNRSVAAELRAGRPAPMALGFAQLAGAAGLRNRALILARKLFPPPGFMRHWYPPAAESRRRLVYAYLYRPVWLARNAARGWLDWRRARRSVRR